MYWFPCVKLVASFKGSKIWTTSFITTFSWLVNINSGFSTVFTWIKSFSVASSSSFISWNHCQPKQCFYFLSGQGPFYFHVCQQFIVRGGVRVRVWISEQRKIKGDQRHYYAFDGKLGHHSKNPYTHTHTHTHTRHTPHKHIWRTAKLSDKTHKHWIHSTWIELQQQLPAIYSLHSIHLYISNRLWIGPQTPQPFVYPFVCHKLLVGLTRAHNQTNRVSGLDNTSFRGAFPWVLSDTPTECVTPSYNIQPWE